MGDRAQENFLKVWIERDGGLIEGIIAVIPAPPLELSAGWLGRLGLRGKAEMAVLNLFGLVWGFLYGAITNMYFWPFVIAEGGAGAGPGREVVHGADGPHAVIATTLCQALPQNRRKVLAFADGRQEAAFFAWYLEDSYRDILSRNLLLKIARSFAQYPVEGISL